MNKPHKHAELIKAWADGAEIQVSVFQCLGRGQTWLDDTNPGWHEHCEYRIKPREFEENAFYPVTRNCETLVVRYDKNESFWVGHIKYYLSDFDWIGDKLKIEWPEP